MTDDTSRAPALSVVVLNYNYGRFLPGCLDSILSQSFQDFEVVLIDDASTDESAGVLDRYCAEARLKVVRHAVNRGFAASLIEGSEDHARGEFLTVVSADDLVLEPDAFAFQIERLRADPFLVACTSSYVKLGPGANRTLRRGLHGQSSIPGQELVRMLLTRSSFDILQSGTIIRAGAYRRVGGYRRDLSNYLDFAMWLDLACAGGFGYVDRPLYAYRVHAEQFSGSAERHRQVLDEGRAVLRDAVMRARSAGVELNERQVLRARIPDLALADAFAGRRVRGLQRCLDALRAEPVAAMTSRGWWIALVRSLAGSRGWRSLVWLRRRLY